MAIKLPDGNWKCMFCDYTNPNPSIVNDHLNSAHDFVLMPILKSDLVKLLQFIYTNENNRELIREEFYKQIKAYSKYTIKKRID